MNDQAVHAIRAEHVGSLVRPRPLMDAFHKWEAGELSDDEIRKIPDQFVPEVVALQEDVGLKVVTDGEFRRRSWQRGFIDAVGGFSIKPGLLQFRNESGPVKPMAAMFLEAKLNRTRGIATHEFQALKALTKVTPKITLPAPSAFHLGLFGGFADHDVYPDVEEAYDDLVKVYQAEIAELAELGCRYVQFDEVGLAALCDPLNREIAEQYGEDPEAVIDLYFNLNQRIIDACPEDMTVGMHLCKGNQAGLWVGQGSYEPIAERLFNELDVDIYFLEYDSPRAGDFKPLRHVPPGKIAMIGIVSTKQPQVESTDYLLRRIDEAEKHVPAESLGICPQCGFASSISSWNVTENPMTSDVQRRKLGRLVEVADNVWG